MKATRGSGKAHLEAKLEPKKHRREQRNNVRVSNEEEDGDDGDMDDDDPHRLQ